MTSEQICDTKIDCPKAQDEEELMCFYHRPVSHLKKYILIILVKLAAFSARILMGIIEKFRGQLLVCKRNSR